MEDLWKKFKEETREHMQKINEFLDEKSSDENSTKEIKNEISLNTEQQVVLNNETSEIDKLPKQIFIEKDETSKLIQEMFPAKKYLPERKDIYGKLKEIVKEIMEKEHVSRAQAYRKAKKRILK